MFRLKSYLLLAFSFVVAAIITPQAGALELANGMEVEQGQIKYVVGIYQNGRYACDGTVIGEKFILTSAHCVICKETNRFIRGPYVVTHGTNDLSVKNKHPKSWAVKIYVPDDFQAEDGKSYLPADLAVLELDKRYNLECNEALRELRLPVSHDDANGDSLYVNSVVDVAGYGWDFSKYDGGDSTYGPARGKLLRAQMLLVDHKRCHEQFKVEQAESKICGIFISDRGDNLARACTSGSGAPVVYYNDTVVGILSAASPICDRIARPISIVKLTPYVEFIMNAMSGETKNMRVAVADGDTYLFSSGELKPSSDATENNNNDGDDVGSSISDVNSSEVDSSKNGYDTHNVSYKRYDLRPNYGYDNNEKNNSFDVIPLPY